MKTIDPISRKSDGVFYFKEVRIYYLNILQLLTWPNLFSIRVKRLDAEDSNP